MSNFTVLPEKTLLIEDALRLSRSSFGVTSPRQEAHLKDMLTHVVELLWGHTQGLTAAKVAQALEQPALIEDALKALQEKHLKMQSFFFLVAGPGPNQVSAERIRERLARKR